MQKVFFILFVGILAVFVGHKAMKSSTVMDDVVLKNIEALADGEDGNERCLWDIAYMVCAPFGEYTHCYCGL